MKKTWMKPAAAVTAELRVKGPDPVAAQADFICRMMEIQEEVFNRMVMKANLPPKRSRALNDSFRKLKAGAF